MGRLKLCSYNPHPSRSRHVFPICSYNLFYQIIWSFYDQDMRYKVMLMDKTYSIKRRQHIEESCAAFRNSSDDSEILYQFNLFITQFIFNSNCVLLTGNFALYMSSRYSFVFGLYERHFSWSRAI